MYSEVNTILNLSFGKDFKYLFNSLQVLKSNEGTLLKFDFINSYLAGKLQAVSYPYSLFNNLIVASSSSFGVALILDDK
ncbi:MAG: hypothetical protein PHE16_11005 [Aliarcobacter sp.]|nr:hypothetical protein [Aliarcobacter sp.]